VRTARDRPTGVTESRLDCCDRAIDRDLRPISGRLAIERSTSAFVRRKAVGVFPGMPSNLFHTSFARGDLE
jgi:hypothetical protein